MLGRGRARRALPRKRALGGRHADSSALTSGAFCSGNAAHHTAGATGRARCAAARLEPAVRCSTRRAQNPRRMTWLCTLFPRAARDAAAQAAAEQPARNRPRVKLQVGTATARPGRGKQILRTNDVPSPRQAEGPTAVLALQTTQRHRFSSGHA